MFNSLTFRSLFSSLFVCFACSVSAADNGQVSHGGDVLLGEEYEEHSKPGPHSRQGGVESDGEIEIEMELERSLPYVIAMYLPNRVLDVWDIFRIDVGIGPSFGAIVRITRYFPIGYRAVTPASVRIGMHGRRAPIFMESSSEFGIGPVFVASEHRDITPVEVGAGVDLFVAGAYVGFSFDELADFLLGIFGVDFKEDDL